jgi:hypothetical protein
LLCAIGTRTFDVALAFDGGGVGLDAEVTERTTGSFFFWTAVDEGTGKGCRLVLGAVVVACIACALAGDGAGSVLFG